MAFPPRGNSDTMRGHTITCERKDVDHYGLTVVLGRADGADLGAAMVRGGWALASSARSCLPKTHP